MIAWFLVALALGIAPSQTKLLQAGFDRGADGFVSADDTFRATRQPLFASGSWSATGGFRAVAFPCSSAAATTRQSSVSPAGGGGALPCRTNWRLARRSCSRFASG